MCFRRKVYTNVNTVSSCVLKTNRVHILTDFFHLSCLDIFTDEGVVGHGELWSIVVDVQHLDEHGHSSRLPRVV